MPEVSQAQKMVGSQPVVVLVAATHGEKQQFQAQDKINGYRIVLPRLPQMKEGETWLVRIHNVCGAIAFALPKRKVLNEDGLPPIIDDAKGYVERHCKFNLTTPTRDIVGSLYELEAIAMDVTLQIEGGGYAAYITLSGFDWEKRSDGSLMGIGRFEGESARAIFLNS